MTGQCTILMTDYKTPVTKVLLFALTSSFVIARAATHSHSQSLSQSYSLHAIQDEPLCGFVSRSCPRLLVRRRELSLSPSCCFHYRRPQTACQKDEKYTFSYPFQRLFAPEPQYSSSCCDEHPQTKDSMEPENTHEEEYEFDGNTNHDLVVSSSSPLHPTSSLASSSSLPPDTISTQRLRFEIQESSLIGKRAHYNDALLKRILNGRSSNSQRWRRRTRRAAAALGIHYTANVSSNSFLSPFTSSSSWSRGTRREEQSSHPGHIQYTSKDSTTTSPSSIKHIPPRTSALLRSSRDPNVATETSNEESGIRSLESSTPIHALEATPKSKTKPSSPMLYPRARNTPLTRDEYVQAKKEWTERYTNLSNLRSTFGTNRNKFWGDFDPETTRKLYKTLLPRALLGLYEMGLWSPKDLAPLAYEARLAAKKYARERCVVPGRILSMVYDGFRSWRDYGKWNVEGMSWEQVWYKYETQIIGELGKNNGDNHDKLNVMQEEITALICLRILERSCMTNEAIDRLFLKDRSRDTNSTYTDTDDKGYNTRYNIQRRQRKAERDIARISAQLERDMEELLKTPAVSKSMMMNWRESVSANATSTARLVNMVKDSEPRDEKHVILLNEIKRNDLAKEEKEESWIERIRNYSTSFMFSKNVHPMKTIPTFILPMMLDMKMDHIQMVLPSISSSADQPSHDFWNNIMFNMAFNQSRLKA